MLAGGLLLGGMFAGCVYDEPDETGIGDDSIYEVAEEEYALGVTLSLDRLSGAATRAQLGGPLGNLAGGTGQGLKDIEEYVNTENLYILFFNLDGIFLFQINKPVAIPIGQSSFGNDSQWFIRIPVKDINENLIHYIEENPFKIAVLANWTYDAAINTGGTWDAFEFHEPLDEKGNLVLDEYGILQGDHISLLSHAQLDNVYKNLDNHGYDHLVYMTESGPHMGPYTEWVANYHRNIDEADLHIRSYFNVKTAKYHNPNGMYYDENGFLTSNNHFDTEYHNMWHVWTFGGERFVDKFIFEMPDASVKKEWLALNEKARTAFLGQLEKSGSDSRSMLAWKMENYEDLEITPAGILPSYDENEAFTGIVLTSPNLSWDDNKEGNPLNLNVNQNDPPHPYIHFVAHADGYVRVSYEAQEGAKLYAHIGRNNTPENNASGYQKDNKTNRYLVDENGYLVKEGSSEKRIADIPFDPKDVYIYMVVDPDYVAPAPPEPEEGDEDGSDPSTSVEPAGPTVTIYGIEYIESRHLYDVDRRGILPSKDYPIPMYGIQDFDPIGEYWEPGVLFNLSQYNNAQKQGYSYRTVSLLRSLSRVEVKLKKTAFQKKPAHVYLRSMNRSARITPVDFFTPTDIIWNGFNSSSVSDIRRLQNYREVGNLREENIIQRTPGIKGEVDNIMQYGPIYIGSDKNQGQTTAQKLNEYRKTTAWPFGIWEEQWGWNWNRKSDDNPDTFVEYFDTYQVGQQRAHTGQIVPEHPRILHTRISRSDYAHFTEVEDNDYWHYIIYVPEKNITDADEPGNIADRPKIVHVEIRFNGGLPEFDENGKPSEKDPDNLVDNFDDNGAYRLYFTEGGRASLGNFEFTGRESWDSYEYDWNIAKQHWPIMRNHEYIFTVNGAPSNRQNVTFQVNAPEQREVHWNFY